MNSLEVFFIAFLISFVGSIPPGSINISVMQLSIQKQRAAAFAFMLGAVLIEFIYAGFAVYFLQLFQNYEKVYFFLQIITAIGLIALGLNNFFNPATPGSFKSRPPLKKRNGFIKGLVLGVINPLSIPFWLGITTYLEANNWVSLDGNQRWLYLLGLAFGTLGLLFSVEILGRKFQAVAGNHFIVYRLPGLLFILMGLYYAYNLWS